MDFPIPPQIHSRSKSFVTGPFGSGKTTLTLERVRWLLQQERVRGDDILVLLPQPINVDAFRRLLLTDAPRSGTPVRVTTISNLARESVELYWPLIARAAGFSQPSREPTFLNIETAQYYLGRAVDRSLAEQQFAGITANRNAIIFQILDNLNRAALHDFTLEEAYDRLSALPMGESAVAQRTALASSFAISREFRSLCLRETLVDFSLMLELFLQHVLKNEWSRTHLIRSHRHLVADNLEEQNPAAHRLLRLWLPHAESALFAADSDGGFRLFLGVDPEGATDLRDHFDDTIELAGSAIMSEAVGQAAAAVNRIIQERADVARPDAHADTPLPLLFPQDSTTTSFRFFPQMVRWSAETIADLVHRQGVPPHEIAIVGPSISDSMRFSLQTGLEQLDVPTFTHRPRSALIDEPATRTLLTVAELAHREWRIAPHVTDVALALTHAIADLDPVRADLLARSAFRPYGDPLLIPFALLDLDTRRRVGPSNGEAYESLREWLVRYAAQAEPDPFDQFVARLFEEVFSLPGFAFAQDADAVRLTSHLRDSARSLRWALGPVVAADVPAPDLSREFATLVAGGALGALHVPSWNAPADAVLISPVTAFLLRNQAVDYQLWLDVGSSRWWERLNQPLSHLYVLNRRWPADRPWGDADDYAQRWEYMRRQVVGLLRRTRRGVVIGISEYSESGFEQRGPLLSVLNRLRAERR